MTQPDHRNTLRSKLLNLALIVGSIGVGYAMTNLLFLTLIRSSGQAKGLPRSLVSHLPAPLRWGYPDLGAKGNSNDIALIGDSYVEGAGDDYRNNIKNYSIGHHLRQKLREPLATFGTNGTSLGTSIQLYDSSLNGKLWPMSDPRPHNEKPERILAFFYEGNDLDNQIEEQETGGASKHIQALESNRRFQPLRLFLNTKLRARTNQPRQTGTSYNDQPNQANTVCGKSYCKSLRPMQAASPSLSQAELKQAIEATSKALEHLKEKSKGKICLVYIPSPATIYSPKKVRFQQDKLPNRPTTGSVTGKSNAARSHFIRTTLQAQSERLGIPMIDSTPALQTAAQTEFLHGINDQKHFNTRGNQVLATAVIREINRCFPAKLK